MKRIMTIVGFYLLFLTKLGLAQNYAESIPLNSIFKLNVIIPLKKGSEFIYFRANKPAHVTSYRDSSITEGSEKYCEAALTEVPNTDTQLVANDSWYVIGALGSPVINLSGIGNLSEISLAPDEKKIYLRSLVLLCGKYNGYTHERISFDEMRSVLSPQFTIIASESNDHSLFSGYGMAGQISVSGYLKRLLIGGLPLASVSSFYGYESLNFPDSHATFCFGGNGVTTSGVLGGVGFGGNIVGINLAGKCEKPEDYLGGFLSFGIEYSLNSEKSGSKSAKAEIYFNLGFDLKKLNDGLLQHFAQPSLNGNNFRYRLNSTIWYLVKYLGSSSVKNVELGGSLVWLKLLTTIFVHGSEEKGNLLNTLNFTAQELDFLSNQKSKSSSLSQMTLKGDLLKSINKITRDHAFYSCDKKVPRDCEEVQIDTLFVLNEIYHALGECHAISLVGEFTSSYELERKVFSSNLNLAMIYSYYGLKEKAQEEKNTLSSVTSAYAQHRFQEKSESCKGVEEIAGFEMGRFLGMIIK
ncbi:MAG: hypothetical protein QE271_12830 [Bacteriovoracaceae bacterium]|nr:hypothetical protein [Bacteriovoracaceae bacterium]